METENQPNEPVNTSVDDSADLANFLREGAIEDTDTDVDNSREQANTGIAEEITEGVSDDTDNSNTDNDASDEDSENYSDDEVDHIIEQVFGKSIEDIRQALVAKPVEDPLKDVSPLMRKAIEWERSGKDVKQFIELQSLDPAKMDTKEVLWNEYKLKNSDVSESSARKMFEYEYKNEYGKMQMLDPDDESDAEAIEYLKAKQDRARLNAEKFLGEYKAENSKIEPVDDKVQQEKLQQYFQKHSVEVEERMSDFKGIELEIDGKAIKYEFDKATRDEVYKWVSDPANTIMEKIFGKSSDGKPDIFNINYDAVERLAVYYANPDAYDRAIYEAAAMQKQEEVFVKRKNVKPIDATPERGVSNKSEEEQMLEALFSAKRK